MSVERQGVTTQVPIDELAVLKRSALELELGRGRSVTSADLIRFAIHGLVLRLRSDPASTLHELRAGLEADAGALPSTSPATVALPSPATDDAPKRSRATSPAAKRSAAKRGRR